MSYSNPQRVINKEFGAAVKGAGDIQRSLENTSANIMNIVKQQKKETEQIKQNNIKQESALRDKVNEFTKPGAGNMDNSIVKFWDEKIEAYVNNMNMAANGEITSREAMIRNKQIEALIPQFKSGASIIPTNIAALDDAVENGTLSSTGSVSNKIVLDRIKNNGDVQIVEKNGTIYYWAPDRDENGDIIGEFDPKSSNFINGTVMAANPDKQLFNNKADISGLISQGYTKFSQEETGFSEYYKDIAVTNGDIDPRDPTGKTKISGMEDGYEQLIRVPSSDPNSKNKFVNEVESSAYLNNIIGNEKKMLSVWQDTIPDGEPDENGQYPPNSLGFYASGGDPTLDINLEEMGYVGPNAMEEWQNSVYGEYPSNATPEQQALIDKNQKAVSKRYMADQMWDQNAITVPKTLKGKRKIEKKATNTTSTSSGDNKSLKFTTDTGKEYSQPMTNNIRAGIKMEEEVDDKIRKAMIGNKSAQQDALVGLVTSYGFAEEDFEDEIDALDFDAITQGLKEDLFKEIGQGATSYAEYQIGKGDYNNYLNKKKGSKVKTKGTGFNPNSYKS